MVGFRATSVVLFMEEILHHLRKDGMMIPTNDRFHWFQHGVLEGAGYLVSG